MAGLVKWRLAIARAAELPALDALMERHPRAHRPFQARHIAGTAPSQAPIGIQIATWPGFEAFPHGVQIYVAPPRLQPERK